MLKTFRLDGCRDPGGCHCAMSVTSNMTGETFWGDNIPREWVEASDARRALAARDAEIERLKARVDLLVGAMEANDGRLMEAAKLAGVGYFGCDTPEVMADTIGELRALVEKRERQLAWIVQKYASGGGFTHPPKQHWFKLPHGGGSVMEYDGTNAGLLAAIDEAFNTKENA